MPHNINPNPTIDSITIHGALAFVDKDQRAKIYDAPSGKFKYLCKELDSLVRAHLKSRMDNPEDPFAREAIKILYPSMLYNRR